MDDFKQSCIKVINVLKEDLKTIRTGHASPSLVENLVVETYGGQTKLRLLELASIMTEGASALVVQPFDSSTIVDIEKAILKSPLGLSPAVQGNRIIIRIPALSEEQREKMVKLVGQKIEEKKVNIRNLRDEERKKIKSELEAKTLTEDDKYRIEKEIDNITQQYMADIQTIKDHKEEEIREV